MMVRCLALMILCPATGAQRCACCFLVLTLAKITLLSFTDYLLWAGCITFKEVKDGLAEVGILLAPWEVTLALSQFPLKLFCCQQVREMMAAGDKDGDCKLSYDEFVQCYGSCTWTKAQVTALFVLSVWHWNVGMAGRFQSDAANSWDLEIVGCRRFWWPHILMMSCNLPTECHSLRHTTRPDDTCMFRRRNSRRASSGTVVVWSQRDRGAKYAQGCWHGWRWEGELEACINCVLPSAVM